MAALACVASPFAASLTDAQRLPVLKTTGKVLIRVIGAEGDVVVINNDPVRLASATEAKFYLKDGEAIEICGHAFDDLSWLSVLALVGTPSIYWGLA